jgi:hypothetical protein
MNSTLSRRIALLILSGGIALALATRGPAETVGNPLVAAPLTDGASGSIFVLLDPFTQPGTVTDWGLYDFEAPPPPPTAQVTPVIYQQVPGGWQITGIGTPRTTTGAGAQSYPFGLTAGSAAVGPGSFLGWKDGGLGNDNTGVIEWFDGGVGTVDWLGPGHTTFAAGETFAPVVGLNRTYSLQADTEAGGAPLETIGNPVVDAPLVDGAVGSLFVQTSSPFTEAGDVVSWRFFNGGVPTREFTPLLLEKVGSDYLIRGIGTTINSNGSGEQNFAFNLAAGSANVGANYYFGWKDGGQGTNNTGVAEWFDGTVEQATWFGGGHTNFAIDENLGAGVVALNRRYSIRATSDSGPPPPTPAHSVTHGQSVINRGSTDSFHGSAIFNVPISDGSGDTDLPGQLTSWTFFNDNPEAVGRLITPLLLEKSGSDYIVRGIGATREVDASGAQMYDFDAIAGIDTFDWSTGRFHMGVRYGSPEVSNPGVVDFDGGASSWAFIGDANPVGPIVLDAAVTGPQNFVHLGRDYSVQFLVEPIPEPSMMFLAGVGLVLAAIWRRRRR